jgi:DNA-binding response OmpR family regulator
MSGAVLIIEDEPVLGKNMLHYLEREGFEARWATSATAGLVELDTFRPDAVVLDFHLPDLDGLQALSRIRAHRISSRYNVTSCHYFTTNN